MTDTRRKLIDGTIATIRGVGIGGVSARAIATAAGVNQALVFYHFGSVAELISAACLTHTEEAVARFAPRFDAVGGFRELLDLGRDIHDDQSERGNVAVLAQLLAGGQSDPALAEATSTALALWIAPIERALARVLADSPLTELTDPGGLAMAVAAGFIGIELFDGVDPAGSRRALDTLESLAVLVQVVDELGPIARRAVRAKVRKAR